MGDAFSPRPWGWSGAVLQSERRCNVFPTPVGMVRDNRSNVRENISFPHARGDGPYPRGYFFLHSAFSPRPWGWSEGGNTRTSGCFVFPTPVGMVRPAEKSDNIIIRFPHARGDGPSINIAHFSTSWFSPRPWGWSELNQNESLSNTVFPTPVGMVRPSSGTARDCSCFPHARGDGPL